jgi:hypothetical protein
MLGRLWGPILKTEHNPKVNECIGLKSSVENTWPRCSYPGLTMHSGSQLTCSKLCPRKISHLNGPLGAHSSNRRMIFMSQHPNRMTEPHNRKGTP